MTAEQIRAVVAGTYEGESWKKKVKKMNDYQVFALYKRLQKAGKVK